MEDELEEYQADVGKFVWDKETGMDERFVFDKNPGDYGLYYKDREAWYHGLEWAYAIPANDESWASWDSCNSYEYEELEEMFKGYNMEDVYFDLRGQAPEALLEEYRSKK